MTKKTRQDNSDWPDWLNKAWNTDPDKNGALLSKVLMENYIHVNQISFLRSTI